MKKRKATNRKPARKIMYCSFLLGFDGALKSDKTYVLFDDCLPILSSEHKQWWVIMSAVKSYCVNWDLPFKKLCRLSTDCDWELFEIETGRKAKVVKFTDGMFYFDKDGEDLNPVEEYFMEEMEFGVDVTFKSTPKPSYQREKRAKQ